jgi:hypothetical protein
MHTGDRFLYELKLETLKAVIMYTSKSTKFVVAALSLRILKMLLFRGLFEQLELKNQSIVKGFRLGSDDFISNILVEM